MAAEELEEKKSLKESIKEIFYIVKVCLSSFWFWLPALFAIFLYVELYLLFINPLLFLIGPVVLIIYALVWEEKRLKAQYGLKEVKVVKSSDPLFSLPRKQKVSEVDKLVEEYASLIKKKKRKKEESAEQKKL